MIFPKSVKEKDINDMVLSGLTPLDIIERNTLQGLQLTLAIKNWSKV